jgi:hypothetical protein
LWGRLVFSWLARYRLMENTRKAMKSLKVFLGLPSLTALIETHGAELLSSPLVVASLLRGRRAAARRAQLRLNANQAVPPSETQAGWPNHEADKEIQPLRSWTRR